MFKHKDFIYIQMQKTGCSHIAVLLNHLFEGIVERKHQPANEAELVACDYFFSSIRNPWDWYVSLWTFGVLGKGGLKQRLTSEHYIGPLSEQRDPSIWREVYDDVNCVESFRKWLSLLHAYENRYYLGEKYGESTTSKHCGFMTHRFLYLCCKDFAQLTNNIDIQNLADIKKFEQKSNYVEFFIRQESLEDDLCEAISKIRILKSDDLNYIYSLKKTNISQRTRHISEYYDDDTSNIILKRDSLIIEKFGYSRPW